MKKWIYTLTLALGTLLFGISGIIHQTYLRIVEPPMRWLLIGLMIVIPLLIFISILKNKPNVVGSLMIGIGGVWGSVTLLYFISPLQNSGWILSGIITLTCLATLMRGDWSRDW